MAARLWYSARFMMACSSTSPVWFSRLPVCGSTVKPRNVMLVWSGLKKMYGWGLQENLKVNIYVSKDLTIAHPYVCKPRKVPVCSQANPYG